MMFPSTKAGEGSGGHDHCCNNQKKLIKAIIKAMKADMLIQVMDKILRPLPSWAQSIVSTVFISVVPIFFIYALNVTIMASGGEETKNTMI
jgi:hypothetical protein